jgi:hypothetical protein
MRWSPRTGSTILGVARGGFSRCLPGAVESYSFGPARLDAYLLYMLIALVAIIAVVTALA